MEDHFNVEPWPGRFSAYDWYLTFEDAELVSLARHYQQNLSSAAASPPVRHTQITKFLRRHAPENS